MLDKLPDILVYYLLMGWLGVRDLGRLDSAFSEQSYRPTLLHLLALIDWRPVFGLHFATKAATLYPKILRWLLIRGLRTSQLFYSGGCDDETASLTKEIITRDALEINRVVFDNVTEADDSVIQCLADNCDGIQGLRCHMSAVQPSFADLINRNQNLSELLLRTNVLTNVEENLRGVHCPSLTRFYYLRTASLEFTNVIVGAFPNITDVMFEAVEANALKVLASLPLQFITLHTIQHTSASVFEEKWEDQSFMALEELDVRCWDDMAQLSAILSRSPQLRSIKFNYEGPMPNAFGRTMLHLLAQHLGPRLEYVDIDLVDQLPDAGLRMIAQCCPNLSKMVITDSENDFTEETIIELLKRCPKLTGLYLPGMVCTSEVEQAAWAHCPQVKLLNKYYISEA